MDLNYGICICIFVLSVASCGDNYVTSELIDTYRSKRSADPQAVQTGGSQLSSGELSRYSGGSGGETQAGQTGDSQLSSGELSRYSGGSGGETQAGQTGGSQLSSGELSRYSGGSGPVFAAGATQAAQTGGSQLSGELSEYSGGSDGDTVTLKGLQPTPESKPGIIYQWRNGIVPYFIDEESYDDVIVDRIRAATKVIEKASCILFKQLQAKRDLPQFGYSFVHFSNPDKERECVHTVMRGSKGEPTLVLGYDCMQERDIIHALMHLLGFRDEVTHPQRDSYVRILWENIQPKYRRLFSITFTPLHQEMGEYDMMSIMHFHDRAYSINGAPTITPLIAGQLINPSDQLSLLDKMKLRLAFRHECNRRKVANLLQTCKNSIQGTIDNKVDGTGSGTYPECTNNLIMSGSGSGSEIYTDKNKYQYISEKGIAAYVSASDKDGAAKENKRKGCASSGSDSDKIGALSGSDKDKGSASSGSDMCKGGALSGSDKDKGSASSGSDMCKGGALSGSNKDKGSASSGSDICKGGALSGSDKDKGSASSGSDMCKGGALSGSDKDKGSASSGSDMCKGGAWSGSDKDKGSASSGSDMCKGGALSGSDKGKGSASSGSDMCKGGALKGSDKDKGSASSGSDICKGGALSGSETDKGGVSSGSDKGKYGALSGNDKGKVGSFSGSDKGESSNFIRSRVIGFKGLNKHWKETTKKQYM